MLVEVIRNEAVPGRYGELAASEVERGTSDDKPRTGIRKQERQEHNWSPGQGLADGADADQRLSVGKPTEQLYRYQLGAGTDQLREGGKHAELKGIGMEQESKRGKVLLPAALGNSLASPVAKAVPAAWFTEVLLDGLS